MRLGGCGLWHEGVQRRGWVSELLLEILSEEIPARMQKGAEEQLRHKLTRALSAAKYQFKKEDIKTYVTPRRLVFIAQNLVAGKTASSMVVTKKIAQGVGEVRWPKSMRWKEGRFRWVRPIRSIVYLFDGKPDPSVFVDVFQVWAGNTTKGHRREGNKDITVSCVEDYLKQMRDNGVLLSREERILGIHFFITKGFFSGERKAVVMNKTLLEEVAGLCEWPTVLLGRIDKEFMDLPPAVITSVMQKHQKFFAVFSKDIKVLEPNFLMVADGRLEEDKKKILRGNERVLRARLADARYFYEKDKKKSLEEHGEGLSDLIFHEKLGDMAQKAHRMGKLARFLAKFLSLDAKKAFWAARFAKADLLTELVGELPELQGTVGGYLARDKGAHVAKAIQQHYRPQGPKDKLPEGSLAQVVALVDKLDTLAGFFLIGETPTGSKDPFGLRRAALGVVRILVERRKPLPLRPLLRKAIEGYKSSVGIRGKSVHAQRALLGFILKRLGGFLGHSHDTTRALEGYLKERDISLGDYKHMCNALETFLATKDGKTLLAGYKRASQIVKKEGGKRGWSVRSSRVDGRLFRHKAEKDLLKALRGLPTRLATRENFGVHLRALTALRVPIDKFFEAVRVNDEDKRLRANRLSLLYNVVEALEKVADFSQIQRQG